MYRWPNDSAPWSGPPARLGMAGGACSCGGTRPAGLAGGVATGLTTGWDYWMAWCHTENIPVGAMYFRPQMAEHEAQVHLRSHPTHDARATRFMMEDPRAAVPPSSGYSSYGYSSHRYGPYGYSAYGQQQHAYHLLTRRFEVYIEGQPVHFHTPPLGRPVQITAKGSVSTHGYHLPVTFATTMYSPFPSIQPFTRDPGFPEEHALPAGYNGAFETRWSGLTPDADYWIAVHVRDPNCRASGAIEIYAD